MEKINLLFLHPGPIYRPDLPDVRDKYLLLSKKYYGVIITQTDNYAFKNHKIGDFCFIGIHSNHYGGVYKILLGFNMFFRSILLHFTKEKFDIIICYDPLFTGIIGSILKYILSAKLIIEINSNILEAPFLGTRSFTKKLKRFIYKLILKLSLFNTDRIKLLYSAQSKFLRNCLRQTKVVIFPDFTPTHFFSEDQENLNSFQKKYKEYILFIGWPFYLKGVDILIRSFLNLKSKFPNVFLKLIGYRLEQDARNYFHTCDSNIIFQKAVPYDMLRQEFFDCYCFVLPSRSEGVPRVIVEAMASGKPIIASKIGGIPELVQNMENGFLVEPENVDELQLRLEYLLANPDLAEKMGERSRQIIEEKYSSRKYYEYFTNMISDLLKKERMPTHGI